MKSVILVLDIVLNLMVWVLIIQAVMSWLIAFNVINRRNQAVWSALVSLQQAAFMGFSSSFSMIVMRFRV